MLSTDAETKAGRNIIIRNAGTLGESRLSYGLAVKRGRNNYSAEEEGNVGLEVRRPNYGEINKEHGLKSGEKVSVRIVETEEPIASIGLLAHINDGVAVGMVSRLEIQQFRQASDNDAVSLHVGARVNAYIGRVRYS
jgi:hypothetical protein